MEVQRQRTKCAPAEKRLQWHPAFYAGIQIELKEDADNLIFENEHQLGTKPMGIDVLVIKKQSDRPVHKNIGQIFRKYNIIEYKAPGDYLSVDDWYKVYGYCCFYKADTGSADSIKIDDLTITLVSEHCPRKLFRHLTQQRNYNVITKEDGIYEVLGDKIPIQIIVTSQLSREENLWLNSLTNRLPEVENAKELIEDYNLNRENKLYESVMDIIMEANKKKFREADKMCNAMYEIVKERLQDEIEEVRSNAEKTGMEIGRADGIKIGEANGIKIGEANGIKIGEANGIKIGRASGLKRVNTLNKKLISMNRLEDIIRSSSDNEYQELLFQEFGI